MATRGPQNIFSGEILPVAPKVDNPDVDAFNRKLLDYLRRLVGKLARFSGGGTTLQAIALYFTTNQSDYVGGLKTLEWDTVINQDVTVFQFTSPSTDVMILTAGFYVIEFDLRLEKNTSTDIYVRVNGTVPAYGRINVVPSGGDSYSFMIPINFNANDVVNITIDSSAFFAVNAYADGTRLLITRLGDST